MASEFTIPEAVEDALQEFDTSTTVFTELEVQGTLSKVRQELKEPTKEQSLGAWIDLMSFALMHDRNGRGPWGTHFGPLATMQGDDGKLYYTPDIADAPASIVPHWEARAVSLKNPVLKARYADLAWDLAPKIAKTKRNPEMARIAVDAYLASASPTYRKQSYDQFAAVGRALDIAGQLKDVVRASTAKDAMLALHREAMASGNGRWTVAFDRLMDEKNAGVTDAEREQLVGDMEEVIKAKADISNPATFDPHDVEHAAKRLIKHYARAGRREDVKRLHTEVARAFEHFASLGDPMLASAILQTAVSSYRAAGLPEESQRVRVLMQEKTNQARGQMQPIGTEIKITADDMETFLAQVIQDGLGNTFARVASEFLPREAQVKGLVDKIAEEAPLMAHIGASIMADDHVVAKVGSVEEDPLGHLIRQASMNFSFSGIWLQQALARTMEKHRPLPEHYASWANRHDLFEDPTLLTEGVRAWVDGDFVKAVSVLIPQIESGLRTLVGQLGKPTTKAHPSVPGASVVINMGDILYNKEVQEALGPDITLYLTALYSDPRGQNLRNQMAHGLLKADEMNEGIANLLIHTLLVLGVWKELAAARKPQA